MRHFLFTIALLMVPAIPAEAQELSGTFRTEPTRSGAVFHVRFGACDDAPAQRCGIVAAAFDAGRQPLPGHEHIGKQIIWDMVHQVRGRYAGGRVWSPDAGKVHDAKLYHRGNRLTVSACIGPVCRSELWRRVD